MAYLLTFLGSGALVVIAGVALAGAADRIADLTGWGGVWVGSVLLAFATSLPELATDVSAVRLAAPDLAAGDLFGSSLANMLILAIIDLLYPRKQVLLQAAPDHALVVCLAVFLTVVAAAAILVRAGTMWFGLSPVSAALVVVYGTGTWVVYRHVSELPGQPAGPDSAPRAKAPAAGLRRASAQFIAAAAVILGAAPAFAWSAKGLAELTGLGNTFMGTWLVGFATSLPELVSSMAAVRLGAFDLAVGNLFGSNAFNMTIFALLDLAQPGGTVYAALQPGHVLTALFAIGLMGLGLAAIMYRAKRRFAMIEPDSYLIVAGYAVSLAILYHYSAGR